MQYLCAWGTDIEADCWCADEGILEWPRNEIPDFCKCLRKLHKRSPTSIAVIHREEEIIGRQAISLIFHIQALFPIYENVHPFWIVLLCGRQF